LKNLRLYRPSAALIDSVFYKIRGIKGRLYSIK